MNGVMAEDSLATSVSMPTATDSSNATQNKISVSDTRVRVFFSCRIPISYLFLILKIYDTNLALITFLDC